MRTNSNGPIQLLPTSLQPSCHCRKSPLKPMLSATRKVDIRQRSISSLDFGSDAVWGEGLAKPFVALGPALLPAL